MSDPVSSSPPDPAAGAARAGDEPRSVAGSAPAVTSPGPDGQVELALVRLDTIDALPLAERADAFDEMHEQLRAALREIDDA